MTQVLTEPMHYPDNMQIKDVLLNGANGFLGLNQSDWDDLTETIDAIYHNGALVNHVYNYTPLKAANVSSKIELVKLAASKKPKIINYISTANAISDFTENGIARETGPGMHPTR